jgi:hypothetical protein
MEAGTTESKEDEERRDAIAAMLKNPRRRPKAPIWTTANAPKKEVDNKNDR